MALENREEIKKVIGLTVMKADNDVINRKTLFSELLTGLDSANGEQGEFDGVFTLLSLPDNLFEITAQVFLEEYAKSINNLNDRMGLVELLNARGTTVEDLQEEIAKLYSTIDSEIGEVLSAQKRDFLKEMVSITYNAIAETQGIAKKVIEIPIELCREGAKFPAYAHDTDAGMDVYATETITIAPGETKIIPTGVKMAIPTGYEIQVRGKSGRCVNSKLRVANQPGTVDSGYRDEIGVIIDNIEPFIKEANIDEDGRLYNIKFGQSYTIGKGEKIAQLVLSEVPKAKFVEVNSVKDINGDRGGGYGSTGLV